MRLPIVLLACALTAFTADEDAAQGGVTRFFQPGLQSETQLIQFIAIRKVSGAALGTWTADVTYHTCP